MLRAFLVTLVSQGIPLPSPVGGKSQGIEEAEAVGTEDFDSSAHRGHLSLPSLLYVFSSHCLRQRPLFEHRHLQIALRA